MVRDDDDDIEEGRASGDSVMSPTLSLRTRRLFASLSAHPFMMEHVVKRALLSGPWKRIFSLLPNLLR